MFLIMNNIYKYMYNEINDKKRIRYELLHNTCKRIISSYKKISYYMLTVHQYVLRLIYIISIITI